MSFFFEEEYIFRKRHYSAEYFFEIIFFKFFVIKNQNYFEWKNVIDKRNQFCLYLIISLRFFFYLIETFLNYTFYFLKSNFLIFKTFLKNFFFEQTQVKKKFLVNDLYNSFSTKILISSTAFFVLYLIILLYFLYLLYFFPSKNILILDMEAQELCNLDSFSFSSLEILGYVDYSKEIDFANNLVKIDSRVLEEEILKHKSQQNLIKKNEEIDELLFYKFLIRFTRFADYYLENERIHVNEFTPILYQTDISYIFKPFVIETSIYYGYTVIGYIIPEGLFEELDLQLKMKVFSKGDASEIKNYNDVVYANKLLAKKINIVEEIENFFERKGIICEEQLDQMMKENTTPAIIMDLSNFFNFKFILQVNFLILIICLMNVLHTFIAFLSLGYDYLLKKLTFENILILYFISSTTLQIFLKVLFVYFF